MPDETVVTSTTSTPPELSERETLEQKYARLYTPPTQPETVVTPPPPVVPVVDPEITALKEKIDLLVAALPKPAPPEPIKPLTPWFEELRAGEWDKAEKDLTDRIRKQVLDEARTQASTEAVERMKMEFAITNHMNDLRGQNPDIAPMERYIEPIVQTRMNAIVQAGKIKSSDDFIREWKTIVGEEVKSMREVAQKYRADGKGEATTRTREVLSSTPLSPQQVNTQTTQSTPEAPDVTAENYFTRRVAENARLRNMGPTA